MTNGVLLFAHNNQKIDYVKQAIYCAKKIKKHLNLPVALATDSKGYLNKKFAYYEKYIDIVIDNSYKTNQHRRFSNGTHSESLPWNNFTRCEAYDITPFQNTIVMDTDFFVGNKKLLYCFDNNNFKINKKVIDCNPNRNDTTIQRVSDSTIDMYWATVFYFTKNKMSKLIFNLIKHIKDNWSFYRLQYQIEGKNYRNDYAFAIALHVLDNPQQDLPCSLFFTTDKDILLDIKDEKYKMQIMTTDHLKADTICSIENVNIHIMNKFALSSQLDKVLANE